MDGAFIDSASNCYVDEAENEQSVGGGSPPSSALYSVLRNDGDGLYAKSSSSSWGQNEVSLAPSGFYEVVYLVQRDSEGFTYECTFLTTRFLRIIIT